MKSPGHLNIFFFFFFNDTATTEIYTLSLHDALPILGGSFGSIVASTSAASGCANASRITASASDGRDRKSTRLKLQSQSNLVCRLLLEKKKNSNYQTHRTTNPYINHATLHHIIARYI